jgi:hypothetical protein
VDNFLGFSYASSPWENLQATTLILMGAWCSREKSERLHKEISAMVRVPGTAEEY